MKNHYRWGLRESGWALCVLVLLIGVVRVGFAHPNTPASEVPQAGEWQSPFNGRDLSGWTVRGQEGSWGVEDGVLVGRGALDKKGSFLWTEESYQSYEISLSYKLEGEFADSGVFFSTLAYQVQLGIAGEDRDRTGSIYYGGRGKGSGYIARFENPEKLVRKGDWNDLFIKVTPNRVRVKLNGKPVLDFTETEPTRNFPKEGPFGLQVHSRKVMTVYFRDIRVRRIEP